MNYIFLILCFISPLAIGDIYKCQDQEGKLSFSDRPCSNEAMDQRIEANNFGSEPLSVKTKRMSYTPIEEIEIFFRNNSADKLGYVGVSLERWENNDWSTYRYNIGCPCSTKVCRSKVNYFDPGKLRYLKWRAKKNGCDSLPIGVYRFVVFGNQFPGLKQEMYLGKSERISISDAL